MIADTIQKTNKSLQDRGLPNHSYFEVTFSDGSKIHESEVDWSEISEQASVEYFDRKKTVFLCKYSISSISLSHENMKEVVEVSEGCLVYQAVRGSSLLSSGGSAKHLVVGRVIGLVKDGRVIEERFLNGVEGQVHGVKN